MKKFTLFFIFFLFVQLFCGAQSNLLDKTFNGTGIFTHDFGYHDNLTDVRIQSDGKIIVLGTAINQATFGGQLLVARILPEGGLDPEFNNQGYVRIEDFQESYAYDAYLKPDGKILIAGAGADPQYKFSMVMIQLNPDGTIDENFGDNGYVISSFSTRDGFIYAIDIQADNKIVAAGSIQGDDGLNVPAVVRFNGDGSIDTDFGDNGIATFAVDQIDNRFNNVSVLADGRILASGHLDQGLTEEAQFNFDVLLARYNTDGTLDESFGDAGLVVPPAVSGLVDDCFGMELTVEGEVVLAGFTTRPDFGFDLLLMKFDTLGKIVKHFGDQGIVTLDRAPMDVASDIEILDDSKILVAGYSGEFFGTPRDFLLTRFNEDGVLDISFGDGGVAATPIFADYFSDSNGMALQSDGKVVLVGKGYNGLQNDIAVVRFNQEVLSTRKVLTNSDISVYPNPALAGGQLMITGKDLGIIDHVTIYGSNGLELLRAKVKQSENKHYVNLPKGLTGGVYFINIMNTNGVSQTRQLIIK